MLFETLLRHFSHWMAMAKAKAKAMAKGKGIHRMEGKFVFHFDCAHLKGPLKYFLLPNEFFIPEMSPFHSSNGLLCVCVGMYVCVCVFGMSHEEGIGYALEKTIPFWRNFLKQSGVSDCLLIWPSPFHQFRRQSTATSSKYEELKVDVNRTASAASVCRSARFPRGVSLSRSIFDESHYSAIDSGKVLEYASPQLFSSSSPRRSKAKRK